MLHTFEMKRLQLIKVRRKAVDADGEDHLHYHTIVSNI
jgi:hypothetical protein